MKHLWHDLETYSARQLKAGMYAYADEAEVMLYAYAIDNAPTKVWDITSGAPIPADLRAALLDQDVKLWSMTTFDRVVLQRGVTVNAELRALIDKVKPDRWRDVAALARMHGLPGGLDKLCTILKVEEAKLSGKDMIRLFCMPQKDGSRAARGTHPKEWADFVIYAGRDVSSMREVAHRIPNWNYRGRELDLWHLDQKINARGFPVDTLLATEAVAAVARERKRLGHKVDELTDGEVQSATQRDALMEHVLARYGVALPDLRASTVERRLEDPDLPDAVKELLVIRTQTALTSSAKFQALLRAVSTDDRLRGTVLFCGAMRTGRWSHKGFQPGNLMRVGKAVKKIYDEIADVIRAGAADMIYGDVIELIGQLVRGAIVASAGKKLSIADLANIEGRVLAWLMGEAWKIQAFRDYDTILGLDAAGEPIRKGPDSYVLTYHKSFGVPIQTILDDDAAGGIMRQTGKVQDLALGFQGALGALKNMGAVYGVEFEDEKALEIVKATRKAQPMITSGWYELEGAARRSIANPGQQINFRDKLTLVTEAGWFRIVLPSGRSLCYPSPYVTDDGKISYLGVDHYTRQWRRISTYGGKLTENVVQAIARDVLADGMLRAEAAGYEVCLHVHDELVTETPQHGELNAKGLAAIMSAPIKWAPGLPLAAAGYDTLRYRKG